MKKLFCKLPPLQWGALLAALIAAVLQALAFLLEYESNANYFTRDAILPSLAALCTIVSIVLGSVAALLRPKSKLSPSEAYKIYKTNRKLRLFPAVGFFLALTGLSWNLFIKAGVLWMYRDDGATFLREFLTTETCLALLGLPLLYSAVFYCWNRAFPKNKPVKETIVLGFAAIIACGLTFAPNVTVKIFSVIGVLMRVLITLGLLLSIVEFLTGIVLLDGLADITEGANICFNAAVVLSGAFPLMYILSKLLAKPIQKLGNALGIESVSAMGFLSTIVTNATTFEMLNRMDKKGVVLNSAFLVSAAFVLGGHLAFTMAFDASYILAVSVGKLVAGICAVLLAIVLYRRVYAKTKNA